MVDKLELGAVSRPSVFTDRNMREDTGTTGKAVVEFIKGFAVDVPRELFHFGPDVVRYVAGVDAQRGEGREKSNRQVVAGLWRTYDWVDGDPLSFNNPITGPAMRTADVGAACAYGAIDLLLAHLPYTVLNENLGLNLPYLSPPPDNYRGLGSDMGMVAFIAAAPVVKAGARSALRMEEPFAQPVPVRSGARPLREPAVAEGGFIDFDVATALLRKVLDRIIVWNAVRKITSDPSSAVGVLDRFLIEGRSSELVRGVITELVKKGETNPQMFVVLKNFLGEKIQIDNYFTAEDVPALVEVLRSATAGKHAGLEGLVAEILSRLCALGDAELLLVLEQVEKTGKAAANKIVVLNAVREITSTLSSVLAVEYLNKFLQSGHRDIVRGVIAELAKKGETNPQMFVVLKNFLGEKIKIDNFTAEDVPALVEVLRSATAGKHAGLEGLVVEILVYMSNENSLVALLEAAETSEIARNALLNSR